jgi:glycerol-3-phosphate acyltransferase PlsY
VDLGTISISLLVLAKHRSNMERLMAGSEPRINFGEK